VFKALILYNIYWLIFYSWNPHAFLLTWVARLVAHIVHVTAQLSSLSSLLFVIVSVCGFHNKIIKLIILNKEKGNL